MRSLLSKDLRQIVIQNEIKIRTNFLVSSSDLGQFVILHYFIPLDVSQQLVILYLCIFDPLSMRSLPSDNKFRAISN